MDPTTLDRPEKAHSACSVHTQSLVKLNQLQCLTSSPSQLGTYSQQPARTLDRNKGTGEEQHRKDSTLLNAEMTCPGLMNWHWCFEDGHAKQCLRAYAGCGVVYTAQCTSHHPDWHSHGQLCCLQVQPQGLNQLLKVEGDGCLRACSLNHVHAPAMPAAPCATHGWSTL